MYTLADKHRAALGRSLAILAGAVASVREAGRRVRLASRRRRDVEMLESLPAAVLRDIGVRRELVPLVVEQAARDAAALEAERASDPAGASRSGASEVAAA